MKGLNLYLAAGLLFLSNLSACGALALDQVRFATNWRAQAEHGGFYQAVVDGSYRRAGLDVAIIQGGPQINAQLLLASGRADFAMAANLIQSFSAVEQQVPIVAVAAMFQIDPVIFMSHPGQGLDAFSDLPKATAFIGSDLRASVFQWLKQAYGFKDQNVKPYGFNSTPFLTDKTSIQEGLLTSEPYEIEAKGGFAPNIFLLSDYGYDSYSTLIEARSETIERNSDLVQRFVDASIIGWMHYLFGDNAAANAAIKKDNPEMTDAQIAYSIAKMKERGIVFSGDAKIGGVGTMTHARMQSFFDKMSKAGVFQKGLEFRKAYTLQFIGKGVGLGAADK